MENPIEQQPFTNLISKLSDAAVSVAEETMNRAAAEVREQSESPDNIVKTTCLFDGTWQKRGFCRFDAKINTHTHNVTSTR